MWNDLEVIARLLVFLLCSDYFIWFVVILSKLRVIEQDLKAFRGFSSGNFGCAYVLLYLSAAIVRTT